MKSSFNLEIIRNHKGGVHLTTIILVFVFCMLLAIGLVVTSIIAKYMLVSQDVKRAIVTCEVQNLDKQYTNLIEDSSYNDDGSVDYNSPAYTDSFYSALESSFEYISETSSTPNVSYVVDDQSDQSAFAINDIQLSIAATDMPMPDTQTIRLVYLATGTLVIPVAVLGYSGSISVPINVTATYQNTA